MGKARFPEQSEGKAIQPTRGNCMGTSTVARHGSHFLPHSPSSEPSASTESPDAFAAAPGHRKSMSEKAVSKASSRSGVLATRSISTRFAVPAESVAVTEKVL